MITLSLLAWLVLSVGNSPDIRFGQGIPDNQLNQIFTNQEGWIGGDGVSSVPASPSSSWWLFSDTWVGKIRNGSRTAAIIVNNTAARLDGDKLSFIVRYSADGKAQALITPQQEAGWFWLGSAILLNHKLYVFLNQIEKTDSSSVFGFKQTGQQLGVVDNPGLNPESWKVTQKRIPFVQFSANRERSFGFSACRVGDWIFLYGTDEDVLPASRERYLVLARCRANQIEDCAQWRFWTGTGWSADSQLCSRLVDHMDTEGTVTYLPHARAYVLVYTENGLSDRILARWSRQPQGPWSEPTEVYRCPEPAQDKKVFCYAAKNHPELAHGNELVINYCTNSFEFAQVARDARLYFPRFIRVPFQEIVP